MSGTNISRGVQNRAKEEHLSLSSMDIVKGDLTIKYRFDWEYLSVH
jgi:hypothetical protein